ncbi:nectin-4-like isoform X1 [Myxocyprinus asiaticus]|uniref:nectin-4-like isoform X1 n=1 Tax=Myxocyprinus asiaticus TaxID=70543 RepID=UPI002221659B|nr:nectin-4-like isoform X1 [Myxocyprinus asiaticus]
MSPLNKWRTCLLLLMNSLCCRYGIDALSATKRHASLLFLIVLSCSSTAGVNVVGHDTAVLNGQNATLFSQLTETKDNITSIVWQKKTREDPEKKTFFIIRQDGKTEHRNGLGDRVKFIGNIAEKKGSIQLVEMRILDEGIYTCIFNLFPSGPFETNINVTVLVPPVVILTEKAPVAGNLEVTLASCFACNARPAAEVFWRLGALNNSLRTETSHTVHPNGTVTVVSILLGVPVKYLNQRMVQCVAKHNTLTKELDYTISIHYPPETLMIFADSPTEFHCKVDGNPILTYTWSSRENKITPYYEGSKLLIPRLSSDFNGLYICNASNKYGSSSGSLYLHVHIDVQYSNPAQGLIIHQLLYCHVGIGFHLQILMNGSVWGVHKPSEYKAVLKRVSIQRAHGGKSLQHLLLSGPPKSLPGSVTARPTEEGQKSGPTPGLHTLSTWPTPNSLNTHAPYYITTVLIIFFHHFLYLLFNNLVLSSLCIRMLQINSEIIADKSSVELSSNNSSKSTSNAIRKRPALTLPT